MHRNIGYERGRAGQRRWSPIRRLLSTAAPAALLLSLGFSGEAQAQMQDDTIRVATPVIVSTLGSPDQGVASPAVYSLWPVYETLTRVDEKGDVAPLLAIGWENLDKTTWRFKLRPNVKFHNGEAFTARAVVERFEYLMSDKGSANIAGGNVRNQIRPESVRVVDDLTVEIKTKGPNPVAPRMVASVWIPAPQQFADVGIEGVAKDPSGTGPFKSNDWSEGEVNYVAAEDAWRPAKVKRLKLLSLPEQSTRVQGLNSGQLDIAIGVPVDAVDQINAAGNRVDVAPRPSVLGWRFMAVRESSPFYDVRVRQAANYAIDRDAINKNLLNGLSKPGSQCATSTMFGYNPDVAPYPYDPAKAKQLLADAGYPNGFDTTAEVIPGNFPADGEIYQFAAQQLNAVGIRVELQSITFGDWIKKWLGTYTENATEMGFGDIFQNSCHNFTGIPFDAYPNLSCRKELPSHCDEEESAVLAAAEAEFDVEKRRKLIQDLMVLNHDNAPNLFFVEIVDMTGLNKRVQNFSNVIQRFSYDEVTLKN